MSAVRAVVFDLDGTLIESRPAIARSVNHALRRLGHAERSVGEIASYIGWGLDELLVKVFTADEIPIARDVYRAHYRETCVAGSELLPGVADALDALRGAGLRLGLATNKPSSFARQLLDGLGLAGRIELALGADQVPRPKPAPDLLLEVLERMQVDAGSALYVGDMEVDVRTAAAAGVDFVGVATGAEDLAQLRRAGASRVIARMSELTPLVVG